MYVVIQCENLTTLDTPRIASIILKFECYHGVVPPKVADRMANSVDLLEAAPPSGVFH